MTKHIQNKLFNAFTAKELISAFEKINIGITIIDNYLVLDIKPLSNLIRHYSGIINQLFSKYKNEKMQHVYVFSTQNIQEVITQLQLHDIVCQKLDHIKIIHTEVIEELLNLKEDEVETTNYLSVILEIMIMNHELLMLIKRECSDAFNSIENRLKAVELTLQEHQPDFKYDSNHFIHHDKFEKQLAEISWDLLRMANKIKYPKNYENNKEEKLTQISKIFTMDSERQVLKKILSRPYELLTMEEQSKGEGTIEIF